MAPVIIKDDNDNDYGCDVDDIDDDNDDDDNDDDDDGDDGNKR
jgi:hypothetical protein